MNKNKPRPKSVETLSLGEQELPADESAECALLGALFIRNGEAIPKVADALTYDDFYDPKNAMIFGAILKIYNRGDAPDILQVINELRETGAFNTDMLAKVYHISEAAFTNAYVDQHARVIKEKSTLRQLIYAAIDIANSAYSLNEPENIVAAAEKTLFDLINKNTKTDVEPVQPVLTAAYTEIANRKAATTGIRSGFDDLDTLTGGFQNSDLVLLAARPSMGKTAFALNIAVNAALTGRKPLVFSLEMSKRQLAYRLLSLQSRIDSAKIRDGTLSVENFASLVDALETFSKVGLFVDDNAAATVPEIRSKARRLKIESGVDMILIDYLQLMQSSRRLPSENRQQEISEISRNLKILAKELEIPIIALSQLSRSVELRADKRPLLSDLRESGALEQDADIVMFLYRDDYYDHDSENQNTAELIVAKNRNGPTGTVNLYFDRACMLFSSLAANP